MAGVQLLQPYRLPSYQFPLPFSFYINIGIAKPDVEKGVFVKPFYPYNAVDDGCFFKAFYSAFFQFHFLIDNASRTDVFEVLGFVFHQAVGMGVGQVFIQDILQKRDVLFGHGLKALLFERGDLLVGFALGKPAIVCKQKQKQKGREM